MLEFLVTFSAALLALLVFSVFCMHMLTKTVQREGERLKTQLLSYKEYFKWSLRFKLDRTRAIKMLEEDLDRNISTFDDPTCQGVSNFLLSEGFLFSRISQDEYILVDQKPKTWKKADDEPLGFLWNDDSGEQFTDGRLGNT